MGRNYALFGVEGPHDQAFISRILRKLLGFKSFKGNFNGLEDKIWEYFIPNYDKSANLYKRLNMPSILYNDDISVALWCDEGINGLKINLPLKLNYWDDSYREALTAFGLFIDADEANPVDIVTDYSQIYQSLFPNFPSTPGEVDTNVIKTGIYVFPDNSNKGILETILIDCGKKKFPQSIEFAEEFLNNVNSTKELTKPDLKEFGKPFGCDKAIVASMASILKPGKTNTVSINDNEWVSEDTRSILKDVIRFIKEILDL
ncbi:MAG: hypothetical protein P9X24_00965 [Candidatus Hatepunaea meridiana]|nr:hypothetical protein [Candidatus Hatepunaea meridiana]